MIYRVRYSTHSCARAHNSVDHIAVHTWSHKHMSTLTNEQLVAELGWCMQIIHDSTGGRVPAFWRPPYGDADNRVRAVAKVIFGLTTVIWNYDSDDWHIGQEGITLESVEANLAKALTGPKSPGLNLLEHEITEGEVTAFINSYPLMKSNNWLIKTIPELTGANWYQNSKDNISPVTPMNDFIQYPSKPAISIPSSSTVDPTTVVTSTTSTDIPSLESKQSGSSSPASAPRRWVTLIFFILTLGAYCL